MIYIYAEPESISIKVVEIHKVKQHQCNILRTQARSQKPCWRLKLKILHIQIFCSYNFTELDFGALGSIVKPLLILGGEEYSAY